MLILAALRGGTLQGGEQVRGDAWVRGRHPSPVSAKGGVDGGPSAVLTIARRGRHARRYCAHDRQGVDADLRRHECVP